MERRIRKTYLKPQPLAHNIYQVADLGNFIAALRVVVSNHSAHDKAAVVLRGSYGSLKGLTSDVIKVNVDSIGSKLLQSLVVGDFLVVEGFVELELLLDEVDFLIAANGTDHCKTLMLRQLTDNLTDGTRSGRDEYGFSLLGLADRVETRAVAVLIKLHRIGDLMGRGEDVLSSQTGHTERTDIIAQR
jgi:hypothetical protein